MQAKTSENNLDKARLTEAERVEKLVVERDASSPRLHEIVTALRKIMRGREEKEDKAPDMLSKIKILYKQARSRGVSFCAMELSEPRERSISSPIK